MKNYANRAKEALSRRLRRSSFDRLLWEAGIYAIVHKASGHQYIGQTSCFRLRKDAHKAELRNGTHHARKLQLAWDHFGEQAFAFKILEVISSKSKSKRTLRARLLQKELVWFRLQKPVYNSIAPEERLLNPGYEQEFRRKIIIRTNARRISAESLQNSHPS
jgi:group I intron endonuclease